MNALKAVIAGVSSLVAAGCHHVARVDLDNCAAPPAEVSFDLDPAHINGTYDAVFVASAGPKAGQRATGRLYLRPQDSALVAISSADTSVRVTQPSIGRLDLQLEAIGAARMGDPMSESAATPGVGFYVSRLRDGGVSGVVARVGSASNDRSRELFDGGYFAIRFVVIGPGGMQGSWSSSEGPTGLMREEPAGYFCAVRTGE